MAFYKEHRIEMRHLFKLTVRTAVNMNLLEWRASYRRHKTASEMQRKIRTYDAKITEIVKSTENVNRGTGKTE